MDTNPLPILDNDLSDNGSTVSDEELSLSHYVVRITSYDKFPLEDLLDYIKADDTICKYVIGRETVPQEHYHLVLSVGSDWGIDHVKDCIRNFVSPYWADASGKKPRGFGNKQYNTQLSEDVDKAVSYAVKLGEFWYEGWSNEYIDQRRAESFEKKKPSNFKAEYLELCNTFQESDMDTREFMVKYVQLKAKYGQAVQMHHAYGYALSNLFLRDPSQADDYVESFLYKQ